MSLLREIGYASAAILKTLVGPMLGKDELIDSVGYVVSNGPPTSVVPDFIGQHLYDSSTPTWYKAHGVAAGQWTLSGVPSNVVLAQTDPVTGGIENFSIGGALIPPQLLPSYGVSDGSKKGDLLYRFTSAAALTGTGSQTIDDSPSVTWDGSGTIKLDVAANGTGGVQITGLSSPVRVKTLTLVCYVPDYTAVKKIQPYVSQGATLTPNYIQYPNYTPSASGQRNYNGWHFVDVTTDMWTTAASGVVADGTTAKVLRVDLQAETAKAATIYIAAAYLNLKNRPRIFFTFDDGRKSVIQNAFPIAQDYNIPCTSYIIPPMLGTTGATNFMTQDNVDVLHDAWWCIANHAYNSSQAVTSDSFSEIGLSAYISQVEQCRDWLDSYGYRGARHHAYVEGAYDGTLVDAMAAAGMLTGRTIAGNVGTGAQGEIHSLGSHRQFVINGGVQLNSTNVLATVEAEVDRAIRDGRDLIITGHDILTVAEGGAGATSWTTADFATLCGYVADLRAKGRCDILPMDRF